MAVEGAKQGETGHGGLERTFAAALRQEGEGAEMRLLAKGHGALAEQILEIAFARGIKVRSDAELAAVLKALEPDSLLPPAALAAIAEILNYLYRLESRP